MFDPDPEVAAAAATSLVVSARRYRDKYSNIDPSTTLSDRFGTLIRHDLGALLHELGDDFYTYVTFSEPRSAGDDRLVADGRLTVTRALPFTLGAEVPILPAFENAGGIEVGMLQAFVEPASVVLDVKPVSPSDRNWTEGVLFLADLTCYLPSTVKPSSVHFALRLPGLFSEPNVALKDTFRRELGVVAPHRA